MCEDISSGGLLHIGEELGQGKTVINIGGEIVILDLSGCHEFEIEDVVNFWAENRCSASYQPATYKGIPFETNPFCLKRWNREG